MSRLVLVVLCVLALILGASWHETDRVAHAATGTPVGFVGCSNSRDSVIGYHMDGGNSMWDAQENTYSGGTVVNWSLHGKYFSQFDQMNHADPGAKVVWWNICIYSTETADQSYSAALKVLAGIRQRIPGATIYVDRINGYVAPHWSPLGGPNALAKHDEVVDRLVNEQGLERGPQMADLIALYSGPGGGPPSAGATRQNNEVKKDGTHPNNERGRPKEGQVLKGFFG